MDEKKKPRTPRRHFYEGVSAVIRWPGLTAGEKALWILYRSYDKGHGAWISDYRAAYHLGRSPRSIFEYRKGLMEKGFLQQELRGPETAKYWAVVPMEVVEASQLAAKQGAA